MRGTFWLIVFLMLAGGGFVCLSMAQSCVIEPGKVEAALLKANNITDAGMLKIEPVLMSEVYFDQAQNMWMGRLNTENPNSIDLRGKEIVNIEVLDARSWQKLCLSDTGITGASQLPRKVDMLELQDNKELTDFDGLSDIDATYISIANQPTFTEAALIPSGAATVILEKTGVEKLDFQAPENIKKLILKNNLKLENISRINDMANLECLALDDNGDYSELNLKKLPKLNEMSISGEKWIEFPDLATNKLEYVWIDYCPNLKDMSTLADTKLKKLIVNGAVSADVIESMKGIGIDELVLNDCNLTCEDFVGFKNIKSVRSNQ
ncbi:MAG: hypothetical protein PHI85_06010 [Victivallaceae bacterium]|nr:hypothetical protein [Victivallaceae bacterium]